MEDKRKNARFALLLAAVLLSSVLYFWLCWRFDNKYTYPRPAAKMGVDYRDVLRQRAREKKLMDKLGLTPAPKPDATASSDKPNADASADEQEEAVV